MRAEKLVWPLAAALGAALLVIAFLLGRDTARPPSDPVPLPVRVPVPIPAAAPSTSTAAPIRAYLAQIDALRAGPETRDPNAFSGELVAGALQGDLSGIDRFVSEVRTAREKAGEIHPPPSCADYHRRLLASLESSERMMTELRTAFAKKDPAALQSLSVRAAELQHELEALEKTEQALRATEP